MSCGVMVLKRGNLGKKNDITLPDGHEKKQIDEDGYRYLGILELDSVKEGEMKIQCKKEYKRRLKSVLKK